MTTPYDGPHFPPPADISGAQARAYEERIVRLLEDAMAPWLKSVELRGERPDTEIVIRLVDGAYKFDLWKPEYPTDGAANYGHLQEAVSVAGCICSDWTAGDLNPLEPDAGST